MNGIIDEITNKIIPYSGLWALWGIILQLYDIKRWTPFKIGLLLANIWIAMYVWYLSGVWIPDTTWDVKYSLISLCWFFSYKILHLIEEKWFNILFDKYFWVKWQQDGNTIEK